MSQPQKSIGVIGARGYTGVELITLLAQHEGFELVLASSRDLAGKPVAEEVPGFGGRLAFVNCPPEEIKNYPLDALVLALPNGAAGDYLRAWEDAGGNGVLLDLSADYRFDDDWYYGLPELTRARAVGRTRIANPGCYATAMQLALAPVADLVGGVPVCFGVSGHSGAGTKPSTKNDPEVLAHNIIPYTPTDHIHEREVSHQLGRAVRFTPHVAAFFRGISMTVSAHLSEPADPATIRARYADAYADAPLIKLGDDIPLVASNAGRHHACVGGWRIGENGRDLVVFATLDNLLKGAATQALQNLNIACGFDELQGIPHA